MPPLAHVAPLTPMEILVLACVLLGVAFGMLGLAATLLRAVGRERGTDDDDTPAGGG